MVEEKNKLSMINQHCCRLNIRLTPLREKVIAILIQADLPLTAYMILDHLKQDNPKAQVMTVYRILDFLITHGLAHKIGSLNAFVICHHLNEEHVSQWLICQVCGVTNEYISPVLSSGINKIEVNTGFLVDHCAIEITGVCKKCRV